MRVNRSPILFIDTSKHNPVYYYILHKIIQKLKYILSLIIKTPFFGWIISLQIISGFASVAGIPLLIPVLEYMQNGSTGNGSGKLAFIDNLFNKFNMEPTFQILLITAFLLIVFGQGLIFISVIVAQYAQLKISGNYRRELIEAYLKAEWLHMTRDKSGEMNNAILREADLAGVAHLDSQRIVIYMTQAVVFLFLLFKLSIQVTLIAFALYCLIFIANTYNTRKVQWLGKKFNDQFKNLASILTSIQQNKKFIKSSMLPGFFSKRFKTWVSKTIRTMHFINVREQIQLTWSMVIPLFFLFMLIFFHKQLNLTLPELFVLLIVFQRLSPQFISLFQAYTALHKNISVHDSINKRLNELKLSSEKSGGECYDFQNSILIKNVSFNYSDDEKILRKINLEIYPCQTVAFVGGSGAGKSTLLDMIIGLIKPLNGQLKYGDILHSNLDVNDFRRSIAYVSQDTTLFDGSLKENLAIGQPNISDNTVMEICKQVHLYDFVNNLPNGLETQVGENGIKLSGGQKQRIALGRALFMNPKLLVLDEATSDLDVETEMLIQEAIYDLGPRMTIIIVAHRLNTVKNADRIYVIEKGEILESGTYPELIQKKGRLYYLNSI